MARIYTKGFELNTNTAGIEWDTTSGTPTIQTGTVRSGTYAGEIPSLTSGTSKFWLLQFASADGTGPYFTRFYFRVHTSTNVNTVVFQYGNDAGTTQPFNIMLLTTDKLRVTNNAGTQIGSDSAALTKDTWYRVEAKYDTTGGANHVIIEALIDGVAFVSSNTVATVTNVDNCAFGGNLKGDSATTLDIFFDDIALNDSTGSAQTGYPGSGKVLRLAPNAAGDVNTFATQTGGTAGAGNNFTRVNEVTPDDATTFNGSSTLNEHDLFNCTDSGLASYDVINLVEVWVRFRNSTADATGTFRAEIEKTGSGTILQSAAIIPNSTTWRMNSKGTFPATPPLVTYTDPDAAVWTQSTVDSMQIGYKETVAPGTAGRRCDISNCIAVVDYTPGTPPASGITFITSRPPWRS